MQIFKTRMSILVYDAVPSGFF